MKDARDQQFSFAYVTDTLLSTNNIRVHVTLLMSTLMTLENERFSFN